MRIDRHIGRTGVVLARLDRRHRTPLRQPGHVRRHVGPRLATVACDVQQAVHRASPNQVLHQRRLGDRKEHRHVLNKQVVDHDTAGRLLLSAVVRGKIGGDQRPALTTVRRLVHELRAHIHRVVIVRRDGDREGPLEAVFEILRRDAVSRFRPRLHRPRHLRLQVKALEAGVVATTPDRALVDGVGNRPPTFASAHGAPDADRTRAARVARPSIRIAVLPVAVQVVRNLRVRGHVIHLRIGQRDARKRLAAVDGDAHATVVTDHEPISVRWIPPDVVQVTTGARWVRHFGEPAVGGAYKAHADEEHLVGVVRAHAEAGVILGPL